MSVIVLKIFGFWFTCYLFMHLPVEMIRNIIPLSGSCIFSVMFPIYGTQSEKNGTTEAHCGFCTDKKTKPTAQIVGGSLKLGKGAHIDILFSIRVLRNSGVSEV